MPRSGYVQAKIYQNKLKKQQQLRQAQVSGFLLGVKRAAKVARDMVESGWNDGDTDEFEEEVKRRARRRE